MSPFLAIPTPIISSTIEINGVTLTQVPHWYGDVATDVHGFVEGASENLRDDGFVVSDDFFENRAFPTTAPALLETNVFGDTGPNPRNTHGYGGFQFYDYFIATDSFSRLTYGDFGPVGTYSISDVPEPATWALLIAGFGIAGLALRRRRWPGSARRAWAP